MSTTRSAHHAASVEPVSGGSILSRTGVAAGALAIAAFAAVTAGMATEAPRTLLIGAGGAAVLLAAIWRPGAAVVTVAVIIYSNAAVVAVTFHGAPGLVGAAVPMLLLIPALANVVRNSLVMTSTLPWLLALLLAHMVSALLSRNVSDSTDSIIAFALEGFLLFILVVNSVRHRDLLRVTVWALVLTGGALGALSGFQQVTGTYYTTYLGFGQVGDGAVVSESAEGAEVLQPRLAGPIGEKNYYAQYLLMLVPLGGYLAVSERRRALQVAAAIATAFLLVGISLTFSRGAAVGLMIMVFALAILGYLRLRQLLVVAIVMGLLIALAPSYVSRVTRISEVVTAEGEVDQAVAGRLGENTAAILAFADHPITGVGPGQFRLYYEEYARTIGADQHTGTRRAHSLYLSTAAELGVVGLIAMIGVLASTFRALWRARRRSSAADPDRGRMPTAFMLSLMSFMTTAVFLDLAYARYFWLMLGLSAAAAHVYSRPEVDGQLGKSSSAVEPQRAYRWHLP